MSELVEFIRGCLDADEQTARAATERADSVWEDEPRLGQVWTVFNDPDRLIHMPALRSPLGAHIARHDPARVLAEVAAKRAIVEAYLRVVEAGKENARKHAQASNGWPDTQDEIYQLRTHGWQLSGRREGLEVALRALASVFEGAPGWQEEWR